MKIQDYQKSFVVKVSPKEVIEKINKVGGWWTSSFKGSAKKLNDEFDVTFGKTTVNFKVVESILPQKLVWLVTDCYLDWLKNKTEWKDTKLEWEISKVGDGTRVKMTHIGLTPDLECYNDCKAGWNQYIGKSLPELITSGKGFIFEASGGK